ncbi:hypothetical protein [Cellulomonas sp. ATA003]|uniref:hypothetical protein n=1 Tax=Cellulomonas sp. ATA003 TaxID=3073064 RepID=UPI002872DFE4|nr:hypothetical protein [Cellulomonas sp. ATA003]WNB87381.1 hypothetical protein REH70_09960 [Cellulomonas sp. ATA003]
MLLTRPPRSGDVRDAARDSEAGSAMAAVLGIIAVTAVIAVSLLATTVFASGVTSAGRAGVQASAAAEAGLDYARARFATCTGGGSNGTITPASGTEPTFRLQVAYRKTAGSGSWSTGCPKSDSTEVRIRSTGYAPGSGPLTSRPHAVMEGIYTIVVAEPSRPLFPNTIMGEHHIDIAAATSITGAISTAGDFRCNGSMSQSAATTPSGATLEPGDLHIGGTYVDNGSCVTSGTRYDKAKYKADNPRNEFPRIVPGDPRLSALAPPPSR